MIAEYKPQGSYLSRAEWVGPHGPRGGIYLPPWSASHAVGTWHGADYLIGWVAVCKGAKAAEGVVEEDQPPCGFSLPMQARTWIGDQKERDR